MRFILAATREQAEVIARSQVIRTPVPKHYDLAELRAALDGTPSGEQLAVKLAMENIKPDVLVVFSSRRPDYFERMSEHEHVALWITPYLPVQVQEIRPAPAIN